MDCAKDTVAISAEKTNRIKSWWVNLFAPLMDKTFYEVDWVLKAWRVRYPTNYASVRGWEAQVCTSNADGR